MDWLTIVWTGLYDSEHLTILMNLIEVTVDKEVKRKTEYA